METNQEEKFSKDWHFADDNEKVLGVETAIYANGNEVKRLTLSSGKTAIIRELSGQDMIQVTKLTGSNPDNYTPALMHYAVKIDGHQLPMEDFPKLKGKDFNKLNIQVLSLNF